MQLARVIGKVVATRKDKKLTGVRLLLIQPVDAALKAEGPTVVAADGLSSMEGELVMVVRAREASFALDRIIPSDCSIVARVDRLDE